MATVIEIETRVKEVRMEGLALLKIVKHCHESLPQMVTGSLLGMANDNGILEITHAFPFPDPRMSDVKDKEDDETGELEGHDYQIEMMRMLREVNVDNNCVGWYQSMYLGIYSTSSLLENQFSYQTDLSPNAVVVLFDPMQTTHGKVVLKCFRLTEECVNMKSKGENAFIDPKNIFEELPVKLTNPGLVRALLNDILSGAHVDSVDGKSALYDVGTDTSFDRLDLSTNPYLEKHLEFLCGWVDDLATEQHKFQYYARQLARGPSEKDRSSRKRGKEEGEAGWLSSEAPRRMESLLISNQIRSYCDQMDSFTRGGLEKLYLADGLQKESSK